MDAREYRRTYEAELAAAAASGRGSRATVTGTADLRGGGPDFERLVDVLSDRTAPTGLRVAALEDLKAARFLGPRFAPWRPRFLEALRRLMDPETDATLRLDVAEALASERDPSTQQRLRDGLRDPRIALVRPAKALQLLGYDDHSGASDVAMEAFLNSEDLVTRETALRVLATSPQSKGLLEDVLKDKDQHRSLRALSAAGLNFLDPDGFAAVAGEIALDDSDYDEIRATTLGALANRARHQPLDASLIDRAGELATESPSEPVRSAAERLVAHAEPAPDAGLTRHGP